MSEIIGNGSPTSTSTAQGLEGYVSHLEATAPAGFLQPNVLLDLSSRINIAPALDSLPNGISVKDFQDINWLSALTECATTQYADEFAKAGDAHNAPWLTRFTRNVWEPDEKGHSTPFQLILMQMGVPQDVIQAEVARVQSLDYIHESGDKPVQLTTFGMAQELLTRNWYHLEDKILRDASPEAGEMVRRVGVREALHTKWYRDMTAMQVEQNTGLIPYVGEALRRFKLPGNILVPELSAKADGWLLAMSDGDLSALKKEVVKLSHAAVGSNTKNLGKLLLELGAPNETWVERATARAATKALNVLPGNTGYGLLGEGVLQAVGLDGLYDKPDEANIPGKIRGVFRDFVSNRVNNKLDQGFGFGGNSGSKPATS